MTRTISGLPPAPDPPHDLLSRIDRRTPALFLDYDGTLTPIVARPELAVMSPDMRAIVRDLATLVPLAVVSGRDRADVESLVGLSTLYYAGSHGFDIAGPGGETIALDHGTDFDPLLDHVKSVLADRVGPVTGAQIEPKKASVAVHYRNTDAQGAAHVQRVVDDLLARHADLKVTPGKMVFELQPNIDWDKGKAVLHLLDVLGLGDEAFLPIYFGDDITDEHAFAALDERPNGGLGVFVGTPEGEGGDRPTAAHFRVPDPAACGVLLARLAERLRESRR